MYYVYKYLAYIFEKLKKQKDRQLEIRFEKHVISFKSK